MIARFLPRRVPVCVAFAPEDGKPEAWGRFESLHCAGAALSTFAALSPGQVVLLSFDVAGERFSAARARVTHSELDADGFFAAELDFEDPFTRRGLACALLDTLSR